MTLFFFSPTLAPMASTISLAQQSDLLTILEKRFNAHPQRHQGVAWSSVEKALVANPTKLVSLHLMEETGGEPDVVDFDSKTNHYLFVDCSPQSPAGRRSLCYDKAALDARKENKPASSAYQQAEAMGIDLLTEEQYRHLQTLGEFDTKTSSWVQTPDSIRKLGGALFGDRRYNHIFFYHNGAESYYAARGFRGALWV